MIDFDTFMRWSAGFDTWGPIFSGFQPNFLVEAMVGMGVGKYPLNFEDFTMISGLKIWFPWTHFIAALPELIFSFGLMFLLIYVSFRNFKDSLHTVSNLIIILLLVVIFAQLVNPYASPFVFDLFTIFLKLEFLYEWQSYLLFSKNFIVDYYSITMKLTILFLSIFFILVFKYYVRFTLLVEYPILIAFLVLGLIFLIQAFDLITMYLSLELIAFTSYILAAFAKKSIESLEAGIKYLILGSVASGFILFGIALLYGSTSYIDFYNLRIYFYEAVAMQSMITVRGDFQLMMELQNFLNYTPSYWDQNIFSFNTYNKLNLGVFLGSLFINLGFLIKLSAAPFHMWTPDVYEGSPLFTTVLFLTIVKIAIFAFFLRLVYFLFYDFFFFYVQPLLLCCGVLSIVWGSIGGLGQTRIKRLFAYSAIVNTGFILLAFVEGTMQYSIYAIFLYLFFYFLVNIAVFYFFLITRSVVNGESFDFYTDLRGFAQTNPIWALCFAICIFSLAGIPPFIGFWAKLGVFISVVNSHFNNWVLVLIIFGSVVSCFYYLRLIKMMFFDANIYINTFKTIFVKPYMMYLYLFVILLIIFFAFSVSLFDSIYEIALLELSLLRVGSFDLLI
jgi:NADH-quinone oxidoreductase subunit N